MFDFFWNFAAFIVALGLLVAFHEWGHFWTARRLGVKVLKFSIGFGKALWSRRGKDGTEYTVAAIPLGGYVKMLDEREGEVAPDELPRAFNRQPVARRMAIVAAGPLANFLFAFVAFWLMFIIGIQGVVPRLDTPVENSIAAQAGVQKGDKILAVADKPVEAWHQVQMELANRIGEQGEFTLLVERNGQATPLRFNTNAWVLDSKNPNLLGSLGLNGLAPRIEPVVAEVSDGSAAAGAGLQAEDRILSIDGTPIEQWSDIAAALQGKAGERITVNVERSGETLDFSLTPTAHPDLPNYGLLGISNKMPDRAGYLTEIHYNPWAAMGEAGKEVVDTMGFVWNMFGKLITGKVSLDNLSGPVSIAQGAGQSARGGLEWFLWFLAVISVNLGMINLLPIPVLDGGHLLFFGIEAIKGKPLSERVQEIGVRIGMIAVLSLMALAIFNDIVRLQ